MTKTDITNLKIQIDSIKEYVDTELCKKCEEMKKQLEILKVQLSAYDDAG